MIAKGPDWKLYYFNPADKLMWKGTVASFQPMDMVQPPFFTTNVTGYHPSSGYLTAQDSAKLRAKIFSNTRNKVGSGKINGLHYDSYTILHQHDVLAKIAHPRAPRLMNCLSQKVELILDYLKTFVVWQGRTAPP